jgi:phosphoglycerate dehydrogenase-like enzyme
MSVDVLCLRPEADFVRVNALPPPSLEVLYRSPDDPDLPSLMQNARSLVIPAVGPRLAPELFELASLELVQVTGAGLDRLDQPTLQRLGIPVANVPGGSNAAVAEYAVTAASMLLRRFAWASDEVQHGRYSQCRARLLTDNVSGLDGLLVGIIGFGIIGVAVAEAFFRMGCRVCFYDPMPANAEAGQRIQARSVSLDELLVAADVVSLHVPLLPTTRNLIGEAQLSRMKPGAVLVQASRGGIVDETALAACLNAGGLGGAAVDVYSSEPPTPDNPLLALNSQAAQRVILTPHIAGVTRQSAAFLLRSAWQNIERVLIHKNPPSNRIY